MADKKGAFREMGVVEGFYGRVWEPAERSRFIEALLPFGLNTYLYAPKHEPALAAEAMNELSGAGRERLEALAGFCSRNGVALWVGLHLEPPADVRNPEHLAALARKCLALAELGVTGFTLLFDDLPALVCPPVPGGDSAADLQARAVGEIHRQATGLGVSGSWSLVPALYTPDPMLEKEFGPFEPDYLARLDRGLPPEVAWFYTGPRVCSPTVNLADLEDWRGASRREVILWDNYPVNDAAMVERLHLSPLTGRAGELPAGIRGYLFNPLLQPALGAVPGATCLLYASDPAGYDFRAAWERALAELLPRQARGPLAELEALTRRSCLVEYLPDGCFGEQGPLLARLEKNWAARCKGRTEGNAEASPTAPTEVTELAEVAELGKVLEELRKSLPPAMAEEARPWLERLDRAAEAMGARGNAGDAERAAADYRLAASAYRQGKAHVLGEWFEP